jgi:uncharacterized membrane protein (UPF0127 family)
MINKKIVFVIGLILLTVFFFNRLQPAVIVFPDASFFIETVEEESQRIKGLSGRESMEESKGMLFKFEQEEYWSIWMKEMLFPLDIIWLDQNLVVVDLKENVSPETYPSSFSPQKPAKYVLEINAGLCEKYQIKINDQAKF